MRRHALKLLALAALLLAAPLRAVTVSSAAVAIHVDSSLQYGVATSASYTPPNGALCIACGSGPGLNNIVVNVDGTPQGLGSGTLISGPLATGSGLGAHIDGARSFGQVRLDISYEIVDNPSTGTSADTMKGIFSFSNTGGVSHQVGLRLMMEVSSLFDDGRNVPVGGACGSMLSSTNVWRSASGPAMPQNFWVHSSPAAPATSLLVGKGHIWGNSFGEAATQPDVFEVGDWFVQSGPSVWSVAPAGPFGDAGTVHWYTGSGSESGLHTLAPGASWRIVFYYGLSRDSCGAPSPTRTISATPSISPTWTPSPSFSVTPTISPSFSVTPSFSVSPSFTQSQTFSQTPTITPTPTATISVTRSHTRTITPTETPTPLPLQLKLLPPSPNPSGGADETWIPYFLSVDADVTIDFWTLAGEPVRQLRPGWRLAGYREDAWDQRNSSGSKVASGIFVYRVRAKSAADEVKDDFGKCAVTR